MPEIKLQRKLIYAGDAHRAILEADPRLAYCIERIKAVDAVEVVHGRWKEPYRQYVVCSECGTGYVKYEFIERANYCPNCGAKMDGDGNG